MSNGYIGEIRIFPYLYAPRNWVYCDGQLIPISQNQALYSVIGNLYGGEPNYEMGVPDLRGRTVMGAGAGPGLTPREITKTDGSATVILDDASMPRHGHTATVDKRNASTNTPSSAVYLGGTKDVTDRKAILAYGPASGGMEPMAPGALAPAGQSQPHENRQPCLGTNFCIALMGDYPTRN